MSDTHPEQGIEQQPGTEVHLGSLPPLDAEAEIPFHQRDNVVTPDYLAEKYKQPAGIPPQGERDNDRHLAEVESETQTPSAVTQSQPEALVQIPSTSKKKVAAFVFGGLSLLGVGLGIGLSASSGEGSLDDEVASDDSEENSLPGIVSDPTTTSIEVEPEGESLSPEFTPVLMTADDDEELIRQLYHNYECALNSDDYLIKEECVRYISGDPNNEVGRVFMDSAREATIDRTTNPDLHFVTDYSVEDSLTSEFQREIIVLVLGHSETYYKHYIFNLGVMTEEDTSLDEPIQTEVWLLTSSRTVNPGEISFSSN